MALSILFAYATTYGSTQEVAQSIAETLHGRDLDVDLQPARQVKSISLYQAVILGAPLYMFRWHADAKRFLVKFHGQLATIPVAVFALGPFHNKEEELMSAREQLDKELARFTWLKPAAQETFVGKFDPAALHFPYNLIGPLKQMPASDERDWPAIHAWAAGLADVFSTRQP
jgi:menaquinone-dependent protoporphyrinogen oxidase